MSMESTISLPPAFAYGEDEGIPDMPVSTDIVDAAYHTAHNYPGGIGALAHRLGVPVSTLEKKVNPNNSTHILSPRELVSMQYLSGNYAILHAMAHALGMACSRALTDQASGDPVEAFANVQAAHGEYSKQVAYAMSRNPPSRNDVRRVEQDAQDVYAAIGHLNAAVRAMMRPAPRE